MRRVFIPAILLGLGACASNQQVDGGDEVTPRQMFDAGPSGNFVLPSIDEHIATHLYVTKSDERGTP